MKKSAGDRLEYVLGAGPDDGAVRWEADVPIVTNPFVLVDIARFETATFAIVFVAAALPHAYFQGFTDPGQITAILRLALLGVLAFALCFLAIGLIFLQNRYRATFVLNESHIYYEAARAGRGSGLLLATRPRAAAGTRLPRAVGREIPWSRVDRFQAFPSMRTLLLKRGIWEIAKLYTPDDATYEKALSFVSRRLVRS